MRILIVSLVLIIAAIGTYGQASQPDAAPHTNAFAVVNGVKIHYLDFGGKGEPLVFISGAGDTAHVFDALAPEFTDRFHVIALTRRGFGESGKPETGYDVQTLTEDVRAVLDRMKIDKVNLIGHSAGGNEMIEFARRYPNRVRRLVFLDAAYDRREVPELLSKDPLEEGQKTSDKPPTLRDRINTAFFKAMDEYKPEYKKIKAPALSFYAIFETHWALRPDTPPEKRKAAQEFIEKLVQPYQFRNVEKFRKEVRNGKVIVVRGSHHYFFRDPAKKAEMIHEIRGFLL